MIDLSIYPDGTTIYRKIKDGFKVNKYNCMWPWYYARYYNPTVMPGPSDRDFDYRDYCHPRCEKIVKEYNIDWTHKGMERWLTPQARIQILHQHVYLKNITKKGGSMIEHMKACTGKLENGEACGGLDFSLRDMSCAFIVKKEINCKKCSGVVVVQIDTEKLLAEEWNKKNGSL